MALVGTGFAVANASLASPFTPPAVQMAYYDSHLDAFVSTDTSTKAKASAMNINYSPVLATLKAKQFPEIYMVEGTSAEGQPTVLGSEPGEDDLTCPVVRL